MRAPRRGLVLLLGLAAAAVLYGLLGEEDRGRRPNVLIVSLDSVRADHLGFLGHRPLLAPEVPVTPRLDALAAESTVFEEAWSTTSWTLPAHVSLFTGLEEGLHGVEHEGLRIDPRHPLLAERFAEAGYRTAAFVSGDLLRSRFGFARGFDEYHTCMLSWEEVQEAVEDLRRRYEEEGREVDEGTLRAFLARQAHWEITSPRVAAGAEAFLRQQAGREEPFFLFLHFFDAHYDYLPEDKDPHLARLFDPSWEGDFPAENWFLNPRVRDLRRQPYGRRIGDRELAHVEAMYDAEIHWVDAHVGRVLDALRETGQERETWIVVLSDHGDEFFDHGSIGHRSTLYRELTRIGLLVRRPGQEEGLRVRSPVRITDIAPTLLEECGLEPLEPTSGEPLGGLLRGHEDPSRSLLQRVLAPVGGHPPADGYRDRDFSLQRRLQRIGEPGPEILLEPRPEPLLVFDLHEDPEELHPLEPADPRYQEALRRFREAFLQQEELREQLPVSSPEQRRAAPPEADEAARLAALGYAGEGEGGGEGVFAPLPPPNLAPSAGARSGAER